MPKIYKCEDCKYTSDKLFNYTRHMNSKSHKDTICSVKKLNNGTENKRNEAERNQNGTNDKSDDTNITCKYCSKSICRTKNLKRHYEKCKKKVEYELKNEYSITTSEIKNKYKSIEEECNRLKQELELKQQELITIHKEKKEAEEERKLVTSKLLELLNNGLNHTIINNITNNVKFDVKYIDKNCIQPLDYREIMRPEITDNEKKLIEHESAIESAYRIVHDRCIKDVPFDKRPIHLIDASRKKYYVFYNNGWNVDINGEQILNELLPKLDKLYFDGYTKTDDVNSIMRRCNKINDLYKNKYDILKYLHDDILLKNNENIMKKAIQLIGN